MNKWSDLKDLSLVECDTVSLMTFRRFVLPSSSGNYSPSDMSRPSRPVFSSTTAELILASLFQVGVGYLIAI